MSNTDTAMCCPHRLQPNQKSPNAQRNAQSQRRAAADRQNGEVDQRQNAHPADVVDRLEPV